jgi:hypothetical protein
MPASATSTRDGSSSGVRVIRDLDTLRACLDSERTAQRRIALVPTMGNLHAGHTALVHRARELGEWLLGAGGDLIALLLVAALAAGAALPSTSSVMRSRWPALLRDQPGALTTAYALDSVLIQIIFVLGPLLTAAAIAWTGIEGALVVSTASGVAGTFAFTGLLAAEGGRLGSTSILHLGALVSPGLRTLVYASIPLGFFLGSFEVGLPAYAEERGDPELAGALIAVFAGAGIVGGLVYGARPRDGGSLPRTHLVFSALLPVLGLPVAFVSSPAAVALLTALGGLLVSPVIASRNELVHAVAVPGRAAESFAWPLTAMIVGLSMGFAVGGALAGAHGWSAAVFAGCAAAAGGAALLAVRMREPGRSGDRDPEGSAIRASRAP